MKSESKQHEEAEQRSSVPARIVHEAILVAGHEELARSSSALAWSGLAGGFAMSASFLAEALLRSHLPEANWATPITKLGYPVGFILVVLGRQQLFTENTLTAVLPLLHEPKLRNLLNTGRLWGIVLLANLVGAHIAAWFYGNTPAVSREVQTSMHAIGMEAISTGPGAALVKGIVAGWLIAMVVWLTAAMENAKLAAVVIPTYIVGLGSFTHIIAGSVEVLFLVMTGSLAWSTYLVNYMLPTLIGNSLGGVLLVAALNHAQVVSGEE